MSDLLTSLDIVNKAFKKTMRGYDPAEVDEFLDRVAESIQSYVQKMKDFERTVEEQAEKLKDYENIKSSLHEALLMAQRTAEEKISNAARLADERVGEATAKSDDIIAEARLRAERIMQEAERDVADMGSELKKLGELKDAGLAHVKTFVSDITRVLDGAQTVGKIEIPDFTQGIMKKRAEQPPMDSFSQQPLPDLSTLLSQKDEPQQDEGAKKIELSDTLNALGIDPNLLNPEVR